MASPKLSLCMIVKNEEKNLEGLLKKALLFSDEIVIVDTGSTDKTVEIAKKYTSKVYTFQWIDDFSAARNFSLEKATGSYFLWLDADDNVPEESIHKINILKNYFDGKNFFYFILRNLLSGQEAGSFYQIRCAPLKEMVRFTGAIHEELFKSLDNPNFVGVRTDIVIEHHGYSSPNLFKSKMERNLKILLREKEARKSDITYTYYLATTYRSLKKEREAREILEKFIRDYSHKFLQNKLLREIYFTLIDSKLAEGEKEDALRWLIKMEAFENLLDKTSLYRLGLYYEKLKRPREAIECFKRSLGKLYEIDVIPTIRPPKKWEEFLHLAFNYFLLGDEKGFEYFLEGATREGISFEEAYEWIICHGVNMEENEAVSKLAERVSSKSLLTPLALTNTGLAEIRRNNFAKAEKYLIMAIKADPYKAEAKINLAFLYGLVGKLEKSLKLYKQLLIEKKETLESLLGGMLVSLKLGREEKLFERAIKEKLNLEAPIETQELIRLCQESVKKGNPTKNF